MSTGKPTSKKRNNKILFIVGLVIVIGIVIAGVAYLFYSGDGDAPANQESEVVETTEESQVRIEQDYNANVSATE